MRIAVIGSGIAGLASAWLLSREHEVTLYEANDYLGGHTHTHDVDVAGRRLAVDTGFIVFNPPHYPYLTKMFAELGVQSQPTTMSFCAEERTQRPGVQRNQPFRPVLPEAQSAVATIPAHAARHHAFLP